MKKLLLLLFLALHWIYVPAQNCNRLVWSDEFDKNGAPDPENWGYDLGNHGFGNNEVQNYTNSTENARIENGILIIEAKKGTGGWTSARLKSQGKKSFTYGRIEFRAKLPAGSGTWPALWMLGENISSVGWPACGEIDIMEHVGKDPGVIQAAMHTPSSYGNTQNKGSYKVNDFSTAFHIYAVEWTETKMDFYIDNYLYYTYSPSVRNSSTWPFDKPAFIIMNIAMGGNWGSDTKFESGGLKNGIDPALTSVRMEVDYVRYYSKSELPKISGPDQIKEGQQATFSVPSTPGAAYNWSVPADAVINSGENTNKIDVTWGASSGNVSLQMGLTCGTITLNSLNVLARILPTTPVYKIYDAAASTAVKWQEIPTNGNTIALSVVPELEINYNIANPALYPAIKYTLGGIADLSYYNYIYLTLKTNQSKPPSNIRLDLIDAAGNYNSSQIFKITNFRSDDQFHTYSSGIASIWPFSLSTIKEFRMYINFGPDALASQSVCWIKDIFFSKELLMNNHKIRTGEPEFRIYPNPVSETLYMEPAALIKNIRVFNMAGKQLLQANHPEKLHIRSLTNGMYSVVVTDTSDNTFVYTFFKH